MSKLTTQLDIYITENTFQYAQHISKLTKYINLTYCWNTSNIDNWLNSGNEYVYTNFKVGNLACCVDFPFFKDWHMAVLKTENSGSVLRYDAQGHVGRSMIFWQT